MPKAMAKIILDVLMTLALLFLMGYPFWGDALHEWAGVGMLVLFLAHHILNGSWHKTLLHGRYPPFRVLMTAVDALLLLAMLALMVSGIMLSNHVFAFLDLHGGLSFARLLHMAGSYWAFVLTALHLGLHWAMILQRLGRALHRGQAGKTCRTLLRLAGAAVTVYGLTAFFRRGLPTYLFVQTHFVFFDFSEPIALFYVDYLAMMGAFVFLAHYAGRLLQKISAKQKNAR